MSRCRSCDAPIVWALTLSGHFIPLEGDPDRPGPLVVDDEFLPLAMTDRIGKDRFGNTFPVVEMLQGAQFGDDRKRHRAHWVDCPEAEHKPDNR